MLISAGQPANRVASGLTAVNLLSAAVLLLLPVLTIPALIIGPPPDRQLQLGLLVSLILAVVIVAVGVTALTWPVWSPPSAAASAGSCTWSVNSVTPDAWPTACWRSANG